MNNQELILRLREAGQALETLARHLNSLEDFAAGDTEAANQANAGADKDAAKDDDKNTDKDDNKDDDSKAAKTKDGGAGDKKPASAQLQPGNPFARLLGGAMSRPAANPFQLLSSLSSFAGLGNLGGLGNIPGLGGAALGAAGGQSLPTTLAELHDNPQLLAMLRSVANNPQMLNMLSGITGQDSQTLLRALQSLQPQPAEAAESAATQTAAEPEIKAPETKAAEPQSLTALAADLAAQRLADSLGDNPHNSNNISSNNSSENPGLGSYLNQNLNQNLNLVSDQPLPTAAQTQAAAADIRMTSPAAAADPSYLDSLLAEWHWQPYARVWTLQS